MTSNSLLRACGVTLTVAVLALAGCNRAADPPKPSTSSTTTTPTAVMPPASAASQ